MSNTRHVTLRWTGEDLRFRGVVPGRPEIPMDGDSVDGPSPMETLLLALASCMASDVCLILEKSRVPLDTMSVEAVGTRVESDPRRYRSVVLRYALEGPRPEDRSKVDRAVRLSREKYCSVLHSLRPDLDVSVEIEGV